MANVKLVVSIHVPKTLMPSRRFIKTSTYLWP